MVVKREKKRSFEVQMKHHTRFRKVEDSIRGSSTFHHITSRSRIIKTVFNPPPPPPPSIPLLAPPPIINVLAETEVEANEEKLERNIKEEQTQVSTSNCST